jgi:predicted AlkP superfamily phosphohydrolase/phosphomutase
MWVQRAGRGLTMAAAVAALACPVFTGQGPRVLLIGLDGADPDILERLIEAGRMPHLSRLREEGSYNRLLSREPMLSPLLWTSIATGRKPQDHGVLDFVEVSGGKVVPITGRSRRVPALWNIVGEFERTSGFVGWYGSLPAEPVRGFLVSDRLGYHQVKSARAEAAATFRKASPPSWRRSRVCPLQTRHARSAFS